MLQVFFEALTWPLRGKVVTRKVQVSTFTGKVNNYDHIISESWKLWSSVCVCVCVCTISKDVKLVTIRRMLGLMMGSASKERRHNVPVIWIGDPQFKSLLSRRSHSSLVGSVP